MAQITNQSGLSLGTNLKLHVTSTQGTDIAFTSASGATVVLTSVSSRWLLTSDSGGIVQAAFAVGQVVEVSGGDIAANEGLATVTAVTTTNLSLTFSSGTPANVAAGATISVARHSKFIEFLAAGGLSFTDGVQGSALHSKLVTLWNTNDLDRYAPPTGSIEPRAKAMRLLAGWDFYNQSTISAIRGSAFQVQETLSSSPLKIYALIKAPQLVGTSATWKYWSTDDAEMTAPSTAVTLRTMDELVLILDTVNSFDKRGDWAFRSSDPGKTIAMQVLDLQYAEVYNVTAGNTIDPKLADGSGTPLVSDVTIAAGGIYADIDVTEDVDSSISRSVDGGPYNFVREIEMDGQLTSVVHTKIDWLLRQATNINQDGAGPVRRGDKQFPITSFVGDVFTIVGFGTNNAGADKNNLRFIDLTETSRNYDTVAAYTILVAQAYIDASPSPQVSIYVKSTYGGTAASAALVKNAAGTDQRDVVLTNASTSIDFAYSTFAGGGHTPGTPLEIVIAYNQPGVAEPGAFGIEENFTINPNTTQQFQLAPKIDPSYVA